MAEKTQGIDVVRAFARALPNAPGVYRMMNDAGDVLYVGKARSLKKRVTTYTQPTKLPVRIQRMVHETCSMEFVRTKSEVEALLLESNLIKRLKPRYNVSLRDDKSFPYIELTTEHAFPRLAKHRGSRGAGAYYGPFASAGSVDRTIVALQRAFLIRSCADTVFSTRSRPCLQYQIKRCTAPCVGLVSSEDYAGQVREVREFLGGSTREVQESFVREMKAASDALDFERAARFRDRIRALASIQARQDINTAELGDADVIAAFQEGGLTCIQVFFFRGGRNYGNRPYFPAHDQSVGVEDVLAAFVAQFYEDKVPPPLVMVSHAVPEQGLIAEALSVRAGRRIELLHPQRGDKKRIVEHARENAREAHARRVAESASQAELLRRVAELFGLDGPPDRIEVYDNSHIQGTNAVGAMIVAGPEGFRKNAYRKFNMKQPITPGDDYGMMREVLTRRFARAIQAEAGEEEGASGWPDLILIDGGSGQLGIALEVLAELGVAAPPPIVAIAKGPDRDAGREKFFMPAPDGTIRSPFSLPLNDPVLFYLQRLRDEAHRFAIGAHRAKRQRAIGISPLDEITGIGAARKRALLHHFGSARAVANAGVQDLEAVDGISKKVAQQIYDHFHSSS
ncbi:MAG TPA: excinuclease ABC subunit UvrC [Alphaproteobacteria bacterium]|nr:excinuclease ABC subunit UvrC [Alphaproteobacteria bacterium]